MLPGRRASLLAVLALAGIAPGAGTAEGFAALFGEPAGSRIAAMVAAVDSTAAKITTARAELRSAQLGAEAAALVAFAAASATAGGEAWASPDGVARGRGAGDAFVASRAKAHASAEALAEGAWTWEGKTWSSLSASREAQAARLEAALRSAAPGEKATLGAERLLADPRLGRLFPEASELGYQLKGSGAAGRLIWLGALARRSSSETVAYLAAHRTDIERLAPATAALSDRIEAIRSAYLALIAASPTAAFPAELGVLPAAEAEKLGKAAAALLGLGQRRAGALLEAMERGEPHEAAAAGAARRFAAFYAGLPQSRRPALARSAYLAPSSLARFASLAGPGGAAGIQGEPEPEPRELAAELNVVEAALAAEPGATEGKARRPSPALVFLERPELESFASSERRYADLAAIVEERLDTILDSALRSARAALARDPRMAAAAEKILGAKPASFGIEARVLPNPSPRAGRRVSFWIEAKDAAGGLLRSPIGPEIAAPPFAAGFARAAALEAGQSARPAELLDRYHLVVAAAIPLAYGGEITLGRFPKAKAPPAEDSYLEAELNLYGGWRP